MHRLAPHHRSYASLRLRCSLVQIIDASKAFYSGFTHRALRHHAQGIFEAERVFGRTLTNSAGRVVPVRFIAEQHVKEDCGGRVPSLQDWLERIAPAAWMSIGHITEPDHAAPATVADWIAEVAAGRTILGYLDWIDANRRGAPVRAFLDVSTGHLAPATRGWLDAMTDADAPSSCMRGPHGWMIYGCSDSAHHWPEDLARVHAYAIAQACDYVLFDGDGPILDDLPWLEDDADADTPTPAGAP
jgi:hypothetical protein